MSIDTLETLLSVLRRAQLLTPEQAGEVVRELGPHFSSPERLGEHLVEIDWLTAYQLQLLLAGRWDELTVGPYQMLDRLGEGGVSEVFKAWDTIKGRVVALKVLHPHLAGSSDAVRQFQRELQAVTCLSHPNIIKTYDAHQDGELHYFAMELVEGMDLYKFVEQVGPLPVEMACEYARQVAQGLQHAHQVGLVHRDVKPANLFLINPPLPAAPGAVPQRGPGPVVKIIDWGLARCLREPVEKRPETNGKGLRSGPYRVVAASALELAAEKGLLIGTADYIAPEQARDPTLVDTRADIYSLGCTLYFLLTAQPPFPGTLMQKLLQHQEAPPPSVRGARPDVPAELDHILQRMLAKRPADRYQIPLLVVAPLRRFCPGGLMQATDNGAFRPGSVFTKPSSSASLLRPGSSTGMPRPSSPSTLTSIPRPGSSLDMRSGEGGSSAGRRK